MTGRLPMATALRFALLLWFCIALHRTSGLRRHMRPAPMVPGAFFYDDSYCDRRPFWPKLWRRLVALDWPGSYRCPDHPRDAYIEDPDPPRGPQPELMILAMILGAALYARLLGLAGLRPGVVAVVVPVHAMALFCCVPAGGDSAVVGPVAAGACTYAVLAIDRRWPRATVVVLAHAALIWAARPAPPAVCLLSALPLSLWTGLAVMIRGWARGEPGAGPGIDPGAIGAPLPLGVKEQDG